MGNKVSLEDEMINLRIVSKQMQRSAKKCEKNEKAALDKLKKVRFYIAVFFVVVVKRSFFWDQSIISKTHYSAIRQFNKEIMRGLGFTGRMRFGKKTNH